MLKSRDQFPPAGFQFLQPETGWEAPFNQSFDVTVKAIMAHRKANPALAKRSNWALDYNSIANELDAFNDARCRAHGWLHFVSQEASPVPFWQPHSEKQGPAVGAGGRSRIVAGVRTLLDWLGSGGRPVNRELAEKRAEVCSGCPMNGKGDWTRFFTVPASQKIKTQLEIKNELKLETPSDEKLGVCEACLCPLKLKVWTPIKHILKEMDEATTSKLDGRCWIPKER